jgi:DNA-directed RNA polymerase subunit H (RpoH/RPB5)
MHILQPKHKKLNAEELDKLLLKLNISLTQLPKIKITDSSLTDDYEISDVIEIERIDDEGNKTIYYRVVVV